MSHNGSQFKHVIFVNSTAATSGGALTVLLQFLDGISKYDQDNLYYIFCTAPEVAGYEGANIKIIPEIYKRKWIGRILWDNFGLESWMKKQGIKPDLIISMQNTGVRLGRKIKQIIYYHQSLPMYNYQWSPLKKEERILWLYKNVYPWFVKKHFFPDDILVVQADWMKEAAHRVLNIDRKNIAVIRTTVQIKDAGEGLTGKRKEEGTFKFIYPATNMIYKNHKIIYRTMEIIRQRRNEIFNNLRFYSTLNPENVPQEYKTALEVNIEFMENLKYEDLLALYPDMDLMVFPSYLETVGLPLLEAEYFGLPIIASDLPYAREAVKDYPGAVFVRHDDPEVWASALIFAYENRKKI